MWAGNVGATRLAISVAGSLSVPWCLQASNLQGQKIQLTLSTIPPPTKSQRNQVYLGGLILASASSFSHKPLSKTRSLQAKQRHHRLQILIMDSLTLISACYPNLMLHLCQGSDSLRQTLFIPHLPAHCSNSLAWVGVSSRGTKIHEVSILPRISAFYVQKF